MEPQKKKKKDEEEDKGSRTQAELGVWMYINLQIKYMYIDFEDRHFLLRTFLHTPF